LRKIRKLIRLVNLWKSAEPAMTFTSGDDNVLRRYLLGALAPESRERVEARVFSEDAILWERLCLVEDELISDYARGKLSDEERLDFEGHFLCTNERRGKAEFARSLQEYVERQPLPGDRRWRWLRTPIAVPRWVAATAAAVVLVAVAGAVWLGVPRGPGQGISDDRAPQVTAVDRSSQGTSDDRPPLTIALDRSPRRISNDQTVRETETAERLAQAARTLRSSVNPSVLSLSLSPGLVRGGGLARLVNSQLPSLQVTPNAQLVQIQLAGSETYAAYRATLHEVSGDEVWSQSKLAPTPVPGGIAVMITLPTALLVEADYYVWLHGASPGTAFIPLDRYDFRVLRK
jgi:hypothetical protein